MELRMYRYRLYPSRKQIQRLAHNLEVCKQIYNEFLELNINNYKETGKGLFKYDYNKLLAGRINGIHSQVLQNVSDRVHKAFTNFFRRVKDKSCKRKGFPRFKNRIASVTYPQSGFKMLSDKKLKISKIGNIPIILHRIPKGNIKTLTIKQNKAGQWFAVFSCEIDVPSVEHQAINKIGIDLGLENFATLSNGEVMANPRWIIKSEKRLKLLQRRLSRKQKGSKNRSKARFKVARYHIKITNQRSDWLHKQSKSLALRFNNIIVEDLNIKAMIKNHWLARSINDASWNTFIQMLSYKAVTCGGQLIKVNPRNTSKSCSKCGIIIEMPLSKRQFNCPKCGFACHRDRNASLNILMVGQDLSEPDACGHSVRPSLKAVMNEAGTTHGK